MKITFSPQYSKKTLTLEQTAPDRLRVNGELFNFGPLGEGDSLPASEIPCDFIIDKVRRVDGEIHLTVILPIGLYPSNALAFPDPIHVTENGPIAIPTDPEGDDNVDA